MFVEDFRELRVYQRAFAAAMHLFEISKHWPQVEQYALTDQVRRSSRGVCGNIAEGWFKRRYLRHFVSKISDACSEAAETMVWLDFAETCGYLEPESAEELREEYRGILGGLIKMMTEPDKWCGPSALLREEPADYEANP